MPTKAILLINTSIIKKIIVLWLCFLSLSTIGQNKLIEAIKDSDFEKFKTLIDSNNVNTKDENGAPLLMWAAYKGDLDLVKYLIKNKADPKIKGVIYTDTAGSYYGNLICVAAAEGKVDMLKYFIEELNIDVNDREYDPEEKQETGWAPLHWAVDKNNTGIIILLLHNNAKINIQDNRGGTPLSNAVKTKEIQVLKLLLQKKVEINTQDIYGFSPMHNAVFINNLEIVRLLLENNADINIKDSAGWTSLHWAVSYNRLEIVKLLLENKADINIQDPNGRTPLCLAVNTNNTEIVKILLQNNAKINIQDNYRATPLNKAVQNENIEITTLLLKFKADINMPDTLGWTPLYHAINKDNIRLLELLLDNDVNINFQDAIGWTPLHLVIDKDNVRIIKILLNHNTDINIKDNNGFSPLHFAVIGNKLELAKILLENQADIDIRDNHGWTSLHWAIEKSRIEIIKLLLQNNADIDIQNAKGFSPLHFAVIKNQLEIATLLIENKANINIQDYAGKTPLNWALIKKDTNIIIFLIENKADVNIKDKEGYSPLFMAVADSNIEFIKLLIKHNANVNILNNDGLPPLHRAIADSNVEITKLLLKNNADINIQDNEGWTALHWAVYIRNTEIIKLLIKNNADINIQDNEGWTSLHQTVADGNIEMTKLLIKNNADINIQDNEGWTPLYRAIADSNFEITKLLIKNNTNVNIQDAGGFSPFYFAVITNNLELVRLLLENEVDINIPDTSGWTPLHWAINTSNFEMTNLLLQNNADINMPDNNGWTPFHRAVLNNSTDIIKLLLTNKKTNVNILDIYGRAPLHWAVHRENIEIIKILLESEKVDVNIQNNFGETPLHLAVKKGNIEIGKLLINKNADVYILDSIEGNTPLHEAASISDPTILKLLLSKYKDIDIKNKQYETPLFLAVTKNNYENVQVLLDSGASVNINKDYFGPWRFNYSCLHAALFNNNFTMLKKLFEYSTDSTNNKLLFSLIESSITYHNKEIFEFLLNKLNTDSTNNKKISHLVGIAFASRADLFFLKSLFQKDSSFINSKDSIGITPLMVASMWNNIRAVELFIKIGANIKDTAKNGQTVIDQCKKIGHLLLEEYFLKYPTIPMPDTTFSEYLQLIEEQETDTLLYVYYFNKSIEQLKKEVDSNSVFFQRYLNDLRYFAIEKSKLMPINKKIEFLKQIITFIDLKHIAVENKQDKYYNYQYLSSFHNQLIGKEYIKLRQADSAMVYLNKSIYTDCYYCKDEAFFWKGYVYSHLIHNTDSAKTYFKRAYENDPIGNYTKTGIFNINYSDSFSDFISFINKYYQFYEINTDSSDYSHLLYSKTFSYLYRNEINNVIQKYFFDDVLRYQIQSKCRELQSLLKIRSYVAKVNDTYLNSLTQQYKESQNYIYEFNRQISASNSNLEKHNLSKKLFYEKKRIENIDKIVAQNVSEKYLSDKSIDLDISNVLRDKLDTADIIIDFVTHRLMDIDNINKATDSIMYAAIILGMNYEYPKLVYLFEQKELQGFLSPPDSLNNDSLNTRMIYTFYNNGKDLYNLIIKPIEPYLAGKTKVYISPSGLLHRVSFAAIPISQDSVLSDKYDIEYIMNSASILEKDSIKITSMVLFGDIDYDSSATVVISDTNLLAANKSHSIDKLNGNSNYALNKDVKGYVKPIEDSHVIPDYIDTTAPNSGITPYIYRGINATEENFYTLDGIPISLLHYDTHGKYITKAQRIKELEKYFFKDIRLNEDPMYRSYLTMAGCNDTTKTGEDGWLTAYEVSNTDLSQTQLVVLSACETALGDIEGNEGIYGLLRGFKMAGVRYIMATLWSVDAEATNYFMELFYQRLFKENQKGSVSIERVFSDAQNEMRKHETYGKSPYYWAGFVLIK